MVCGPAHWKLLPSPKETVAAWFVDPRSLETVTKSKGDSSCLVCGPAHWKLLPSPKETVAAWFVDPAHWKLLPSPKETVAAWFVDPPIGNCYQVQRRL